MDNIKHTATQMHRHLSSASATAFKRPFISLIAILLVGGTGYWYFASTEVSSASTYTIGTVEKGTLVVSVSGTGQVSASNQVDIKPKASGDVTSVPVRTGQTVASGQAIAYLDSREAQKAVRDARANLESAQLSLDKINKPTDALTTLQTENKITASKDTLAKSYDDGYNEISNTFLDIPGVMAGLDDVLNSNKLSTSGTQTNIDAYGALISSFDIGYISFHDDAGAKYKKARADYDAAFLHYRTLTRSIDSATTEKEIQNTYELVKTIADSVKSTYDYLSYVEDKLQSRNQNIPALLTTHKTSLNSYTSKTNSHVTSLLSIINTITSTKRSLTEQEQSLKDLNAGADETDVASAQLTLRQRQNALQDALEKLSDYTVRAPFSGTIASLDVQRGQSVSSGGALGVLITKDKIAEIALNEVDIATVKIGQKATLTFDAVDGLEISGKVVAVETIGVVSQGVVTYTVKIGFDTQDDRVRPGMSVSANIITDIRADVLLVPTSAVKSNANGSYVEVPAAPLTEAQKQQRTGLEFLDAPEQSMVTIGASNDTSTEITSGLTEGDTIITRTTKTSATATTQAPSLIGGFGGGPRSGGANFGGNGTRVPTR
jgi:HlyD family secretion protein